MGNSFYRTDAHGAVRRLGAALLSPGGGGFAARPGLAALRIFRYGGALPRSRLERNRGVDRTHEPPLLQPVRPDSGHGGREIEALPPQRRGAFPSRTPRCGIGKRDPAGHCPKAGAAPPDRRRQRHEQKYERDRRLAEEQTALHALPALPKACAAPLLLRFHGKAPGLFRE